MNPYAESQVSNLAVESRIHWLIILQAVGIYLLVAVPLYLLPLGIDSWQDVWAFLAIAIGLSPWLFGATYLAVRAGKGWAIDGFIFSIATSFATILTDAIYRKTFPELESDLLIDISFRLLMFTIITMIIMAITKGVLWLIRVLMSKLRSPRNESSAV